MKTLVAISTCRKGLLSNQAIRDTWGKNLPDGWDLRFFIGGKYFTDDEWQQLNKPDFMGSPGTLGRCDPSKMSKVEMPTNLQPDEIVLPEVDDGYLGLPWKTTESLRWAMDRDYDYVIRGFEDTYLMPNRIADADWTGIDAAGWDFGCGPCPAHPNISHMNCPLGGAGYITSRKAIEAILDPSNCSLNPLYSSHWGEDTMVGWALTNAGIKLFDDDRWKWDYATPFGWNKQKFSIHLCDRGRKYDPAEMIAAHKSVTEGIHAYPEWDGKCHGVLENGKVCGHMRFRQSMTGPKCRHCGYAFNVGIKTTI